jgi:hypothetical protein
MLNLVTRSITLGLLALLGYGCPAEPPTQCVRDEDCAAQQACSDGRCRVRLGDGALSPDGRAAREARPLPPDSAALHGDGTTCTDNGDGQVAFSELLFQVPSTVTTELGHDLTVDLAGSMTAGKRQWDLSVVAATEAGAVEVSPVLTWAAADFPGATYASELSAGYGVFSKTRLLGVFKVSPAALQLIGLISETPNHTRVTYSEPLDMLRFPMAVGAHFGTDAVASGHSDLFPVVSWTESYTIDVLERGTLRLHKSLALDALLVRVRQQVHSMGWPLSSSTAFLFLSPCYGTVARLIATSDPGAQLTAVQATELWRLAAPRTP